MNPQVAKRKAFVFKLSIVQNCLLCPKLLSSTPLCKAMSTFKVYFFAALVSLLALLNTAAAYNCRGTTYSVQYADSVLTRACGLVRQGFKMGIYPHTFYNSESWFDTTNPLYEYPILSSGKPFFIGKYYYSISQPRLS